MASPVPPERAAARRDGVPGLDPQAIEYFENENNSLKRHQNSFHNLRNCYIYENQTYF